jgi:precorrin-6A synthase
VRTVYVIGIGSGDPEQLTLQAVAALNRVDVFFLVDKGAAPSCWPGT